MSLIQGRARGSPLYTVLRILLYVRMECISKGCKILMCVCVCLCAALQIVKEKPPMNVVGDVHGKIAIMIVSNTPHTHYRTVM